MEPPVYPPHDPAPAARAYDPLAVALGNASLLGIGYVMLRRRLLAVFSLAVLVSLGYLVIHYKRPWCEFVVLGWWVAVIAHGWLLARWRAARVTRGRQRIVGLAATVVVLLVLGFLRYDVSAIEHRVVDARDDGNCAKVLSAQDGVWLGDRLADAPLAARGDVTVHDCRRLQDAKARLTIGLTGDTSALRSGFGTLAAVLAKPGNRNTVGTVLNGFLRGLPVSDACRTVTITDWLRARRPSHNELDRSAAAAARTAPAALTGCGNNLMADHEWRDARQNYQQLLTQYPHSVHATTARAGIRRATLNIELANVRTLLAGSSYSQPEYCTKPAKYGGAPPYGSGTNRALFYGNDTYTDKLPSTWRAPDVAHTTLVVCAGDDKDGTPTQTCPYTGENQTFSDFPTDVTFHKIAIPVRVYELRTGKLVAHRTIEISGSSCPEHFTYSSYIQDFGPPSDEYVSPTRADIRTAFEPLIER